MGQVAPKLRSLSQMWRFDPLKMKKKCFCFHSWPNVMASGLDTAVSASGMCCLVSGSQQETQLSSPVMILDMKVVSVWHRSWCLLSAQVWCPWWNHAITWVVRTGPLQSCLNTAGRGAGSPSVLPEGETFKGRGAKLKLLKNLRRSVGLLLLLW